MARSMQRLLVAASFAAGGALRRQGSDDRKYSGADELAYVSMIKKVNTLPRYMIGPDAHDEFKTKQHMQEGSWAMRVYNTNEKMTSALWKNETDERCVLAISSYHSDLTDYMAANTDQATPNKMWKVCDNFIKASYVKLLREHSRLKNFTRIASAVGGCKELFVVGHAAGGAVAETLAVCTNGNQPYDVLPNNTKRFHVHGLYTFGAPAVTNTTIVNPLTPTGCFHGKRIVNDKDSGAAPFWTKGLNHSMYDSVEISENGVGPTLKVTPCLKQRPGPEGGKALVAHLKSRPRSDIRPQDISTYESLLKSFYEEGHSQFVTPTLLDKARTPGSPQ